MEQIRQRARAGLMAAPRVGMAVGGLLLGVREDSRIRILDSIDLPCSHSTGPSFTLTPEEKRESTEMVAEANALSAASKVSVVGWYCSKTRGDAVLSFTDRGFFDELFPGAGQLAVVLLPDVFESMRAAFFYRDGSGAVVKGLECEVDEWRASTPAAPTAAPPPEPVDFPPAEPAPEPPKVIQIRQPAPKAAEAEPEPHTPSPALAASRLAVETRLQDIIGLSEGEPAVRLPAPPAYVPPDLGVPNFATPKSRPSGRLPLILLITAAVIVAGFAAFFTRNNWIPRPPLSLTFSELNGSVLIHWDPDSLRGIDHASMYVNDGGQPAPSVIPLERFQILSGQLSYTPKTNHITAKLDAGSVSAFNTWVAAEKPAPETKQESPKPDEPPASPPAVDFAGPAPPAKPPATGK